MLDSVLNSFAKAFEAMPLILSLGLLGILLVLSVFFAVKIYLHHRRNSAITSYQQGVVAPVQYGSREISTPEDAFARRLEDLAESEGQYDLTRLMPKARELGAIAKTGFSTAPILKDRDLGVLALVEEVAQEVGDRCRVLVHASLESLIDLHGEGAGSIATRVSLSGINLKLAVVDRYGRLVVAVDHLGETPLGRQENINRTVVIEVLRKAGVWYLEIPNSYSREDAKAQLTAVLRGKIAAHKGKGQGDDSQDDEGHQVA